jgi:isopropylmalate/homocitrate/citramalate synthase
MPQQQHIEIMDTTLRDGEQTSGVSFSASEKLTISQLLLTEVKVDRIEIASARVSEGEFDAVKKITKWAKANGFLNKVEEPADERFIKSFNASTKEKTGAAFCRCSSRNCIGKKKRIGM